jgi:hypothetical protein
MNVLDKYSLRFSKDLLKRNYALLRLRYIDHIKERARFDKRHLMLLKSIVASQRFPYSPPQNNIEL